MVYIGQHDDTEIKDLSTHNIIGKHENFIATVKFFVRREVNTRFLQINACDKNPVFNSTKTKILIFSKKLEGTQI